MLISVEVSEKSFGSKTLYKDLDFDIQENEKVGLIGRNGTGKSTLFNIITGEDKDFEGEIGIKRGTIVVSSRQEHHGHENKTVLEYIQGDLPEYARLTHIIDTFPDTMGNDNRKLQIFSDALDRFGQLNYYQIEDEIQQAFEKYQIDSKKMHVSFGSLSGGERRMVDLIKVQRSRGDINLIDEPTNHMDYIAKAEFVKWLKASPEAALVITHDRDVLSIVDRIIEIRDGRCFSFRGNYQNYLRTNTSQTTNLVNDYESSQRRISNLEDDVIRFRRLKEKARNPGTIKRFKSQEMKAQAEISKLRGTVKPSFWIDQESVKGMNDKLLSAYDKHKTKNINLTTRKKTDSISDQTLIKVTNLSLGYGKTPLFENINFTIRSGERIRLHGRNGAGKSTIVKAIMSQVDGSPSAANYLKGSIETRPAIKIGLYEQEIDTSYLGMTLYEAIEKILRDKNLPISDQKIKQLMSDYLFNPMADGKTLVDNLSGGQKARVQLIAMLANDPQMLILDEPTNHLDLPSIEELENAMQNYYGAIIYISHDSFFANKIGGEEIKMDQSL
ncbi:MAG: ABC-F family ATP-binding cassette domain-containing protein [bacterium]|nr:ABC transporter ATP-binding protein [bacterium]